MNKFFLFLLSLSVLSVRVYAAPDTTMSITPAAVNGAVITAADENTRNNAVSTAYNAHSHTDISQTGNTLNVGQGTAGDKTITAYNADTNKPYIKYDDTNNWWVASDDGVAPSTVLSGQGIKFEGSSDDANETTIKVTNPTADREFILPDADIDLTTGLPKSNGGTGNTTGAGLLPSGAVFFMVTNSCPAWTTDVSATYADKFVKINATQGTTSGVVLTGATDSHTLSTNEIPAHTHPILPDGAGNSSGTGNFLQGATADDNYGSLSTGSNSTTGSGHTHNLSTATTLEPSSVTMKACQVN